MSLLNGQVWTDCVSVSRVFNHGDAMWSQGGKYVMVDEASIETVGKIISQYKWNNHKSQDCIWPMRLKEERMIEEYQGVVGA